MILNINKKQLKKLKENLCPKMLSPEIFDFLVESLQHLSEIKKEKNYELMHEVFEKFQHIYQELYGNSYQMDPGKDHAVLKGISRNAKSKNIDLNEFFRWSLKNYGARIKNIGLIALPALINVYLESQKKVDL